MVAKRGDSFSNICLPKNSFILVNSLKSGKEKNLGERGREVFVCLKDWFRPVFLFF